MNDNASDTAGDISVIAAVISIALMLDDDDSEDRNDFDDVEQMVLDELRRERASKRRRELDDEGNPKKRCRTNYNHARALKCVMEDYFDPKPTFNDRQFERFFRTSRSRVESLLPKLARDKYWTLSYDCCKQMSNAPEVKLLAALKMACYGESFTAWQDYFQMGESTARECLSKLMRFLVDDEAISGQYLRKMNKADARKVEKLHFERFGVHGILGALDVSQIPWGNCPSAQKGQHTGKPGAPTLGLEATADANLWIWHWNFGSPGSLNDINVWETSSMLRDMTHGKIHELDFDFTVNGETFSMLYWLVDLIYPQLARFLRARASPTTRIDRLFTAEFDAWRKVIECAFGVWKKKYHSVVHPIQLFFVDDIWYLVGGTLILHNMMVEERIQRQEEESESYYELVADHDPQYRANQQDVTVTAAAEEAIAAEDARFEEHAELADLDSEVVDLTFREQMHEAELLTRNMRYTQFYWRELMDVEEHFRLQNAIKHQLYREKYGHDSDGDEVAAFDPLEDFDLD